jgi:hypothetical protein
VRGVGCEGAPKRAKCYRQFGKKRQTIKTKLIDFKYMERKKADAREGRFCWIVDGRGV